MGRKTKSRTPRGARGNPFRGNGNSRNLYHDLNVPLPLAPLLQTSTSTITAPSSLSQRSQILIDRLSHTGYSAIALSHTAFGQFRPDRDSVSNAFPLLPANPGITILKRLNVTLEEMSDVSAYGDISASPAPIRAGMTRYDIIACNARTDSIFSAVCSSAGACDVIMLDYHSSGRLPYRLRGADIRAATERGAVFEICYGPAIADVSKRRGLVRTAREFVTASNGIRNPAPRLILSSGVRAQANGGADLGTMALRTPGDLINVLKVVLDLNDRLADAAMTDTASYVLNRSRDRKTGKTTQTNDSAADRIVSVFDSVTDETGDDSPLGRASDLARQAPLVGELFDLFSLPVAKRVKIESKVEDVEDVEEGDGPQLGDGFITL